MENLQAALDYAKAHQDDHVNALKSLCAIPSVSTLDEHKPDMQRCAQWLAKYLRELGVNNVDIMPTDGHPVVYGEWLEAPGEPVVLVYGHYDVQPVDPIDEWDSNPFDPEIRWDSLYARGASDMKGQIVACLKALEACVETGGFPCNLKFLFEGEEEIGSPNLEAFVDKHADMLWCDVILNCDGGIQAPDLPAITYGLRGLAYFELEVHGPTSDLHSGLFGGAVHNPAQAVCELVAGMHDATGRVTLPGFYDDVRELPPDERQALAEIPMPEEQWLKLTGAPASWGEPEFSLLERVGARPTLEVNGIVGGFTAEGAKTVLPAKARAKISMRLVPHQTPDKVAEQLRAYLGQNAPNTVTWELKQMAGAVPAIMNRDSRYMESAKKALETVFGKAPVFKLEGGTIPVVSILKDKLRVDSILLGFELPDAAFHGPNEKMHLPTFHCGVDTYIHFLQNICT